MEKYCPGNAIKELKEEFWNHVMIGANVDKYVVPTGRVIATVSIKVPYKADLEEMKESNKMMTSMLKQGLQTLKISESEALFLENVLHFFCLLKSDPQQQITYKDIDQIGNGIWKNLSSNAEGNAFLRIKQRKKVDSKTRYSTFKIKELDKSEEPKALVSVDSMLNWSDHESEDMEKGASEVYGMITGYGDILMLQMLNTQFALWGYPSDLSNTTNMLKYTEKLNEQAKIDKINNQIKLEESNARFDKWKESSKNLVKLINSSMSSRSKFGLGYGDTFGSDEVFDLSAPSIFDSCLKDAIEKPLYDWFVKPVGMHAVPPSITGTFMPPSNKPDIDDTQFTYGSKSDNYSESNSVSNDFVSCETSDKSSDSETTA
ncbi:hypothetical protein Tco_0110578 [Tanacetum coccineum]